VTAVFLLVRDLAFGGAVTGQGTVSGGQLRRFRLSHRQAPADNALGEFDNWLERVVVESGLPWSTTTAVLLALLVGLAVGGGLFVWLEAPMPATLGMFAGMAVVLMYLMYTRSRRLSLLQEQLPQALEMLARAVHAGESLDQAVQLVGEQSSEPLATEFRRCANQLNMGLSLSAVMRALVHRVRLLDFRIFSTTLTVHRTAGGNLAATLERLATVMRERLSARRQMRAATAAGRMSATFMLVLGPLVFAYMFFLQRDYVGALLETPVGQSAVLLAAFLEVVGAIWILRMLREEY
jgi:tight adherence protein B